MVQTLSPSQKQMLDEAQDAAMFLRRMYFETALAISSLPAVSHIKFLIADNLTHPTRNKSSSLSITDRPSTKQMCENLCCNYLQKSCQQLLPQKIFWAHRNILYLLSNMPGIKGNFATVLTTQLSVITPLVPWVSNQYSFQLLWSPKISLFSFDCNYISNPSKLGSEYQMVHLSSSTGRLCPHPKINK